MRFEDACMKITEMLRREFVLEELKARNKHDALAELAGVFVKGKIKVNPEAMLHVLLERERLGSTGIGDGIAIPHGKVQGGLLRQEPGGDRVRGDGRKARASLFFADGAGEFGGSASQGPGKDFPNAEGSELPEKSSKCGDARGSFPDHRR
jgi:hypothetical protein